MNTNTGIGIETAENLARFFLVVPIVTDVYVFGSCAMWGDGSDIDLILQVSDETFAFGFLEMVRANFELRQKLEQDLTRAERNYGVVSGYRNRVAEDLLILGNNLPVREFRIICWHGMYYKWDETCRETSGNPYVRARKIEVEFFRPTDLFIMPPSWQGDRRVRELLPSWNSNRPWAEFDFLTVAALQARRYNPLTGHFDPRERSTQEVEAKFRKARQLARRRFLYGKRRIREELEQKPVMGIPLLHTGEDS